MIMTLRKFSPFGESPSIVLNPRFRTLFHDASLGRCAHEYLAHSYILVTILLALLSQQWRWSLFP